MFAACELLSLLLLVAAATVPTVHLLDNWSAGWTAAFIVRGFGNAGDASASRPKMQFFSEVSDPMARVRL